MLDVHWSDDRQLADLVNTDDEDQAAEPYEPLIEDECGA